MEGIELFVESFVKMRQELDAAKEMNDLLTKENKELAEENRKLKEEIEKK